MLLKIHLVSKFKIYARLVKGELGQKKGCNGSQVTTLVLLWVGVIKVLLLVFVCFINA